MAEGVRPLQDAVRRRVVEERYAAKVRLPLCIKSDSAALEYDRAPTIIRGQHGSSLDRLAFKVSPLVVDPRQVATAEEITNFSCLARRDHRIGGPEMEHPSPAQRNRALIGNAEGHWSGRVCVHHPSLHPTRDLVPRRPCG